MRQSDAWEAVAAHWVELVRSGEDVPYAWNSAAFLEVVPAPGRLTVDVGCGEGRFARDLAARGHRVIGIDASPTLVAHARAADPDGDYRIADAAALPLEEQSADLVVAYMSLQDVEDAHGAIGEAGRVLEPGGRFCAALVHPVASAGRFEDEDTRFAIRGTYLEPFAQHFPIRSATVPSIHRPLGAYFGALEAAGLLIDSVREIPTRRRAPGLIPMFLHLRAVKPVGLL